MSQPWKVPGSDEVIDLDALVAVLYDLDGTFHVCVLRGAGVVWSTVGGEAAPGFLEALKTRAEHPLP